MASPDNWEYWNHNTAYHPWLLDIAARHRGDVLDVGCGDGLLARRLAPMSRAVTAIDADAAAVQRAQDRLAGHANVTVSHTDFEAFDAGAAWSPTIRSRRRANSPPPSAGELHVQQRELGRFD
jgi:16S rRNA A1518/A1519 N6-dimethyltransferase RsmA/KsgA/DIM1 with predicted DNA glycosylase/AP lyase activity